MGTNTTSSSKLEGYRPNDKSWHIEVELIDDKDQELCLTFALIISMEGYEHLLLYNVWMEIFYRKRFLWPLEDAFSALRLSLRIPSFYIDACLHTCPGDARISIVCSFFLDYSRNYQSVSFMTQFSCWFNRRTLFICNQLISIHKALTRHAQQVLLRKVHTSGDSKNLRSTTKALDDWSTHIPWLYWQCTTNTWDLTIQEYVTLNERRISYPKLQNSVCVCSKPA